MMARSALMAILLCSAWASAGEALPPDAGPDLDVTFIERLPRYPACEVRSEDGLPVVIRPGTGEILPPDEWNDVQRAPRDGDEVRFIGHVVNHGRKPSGPFQYRWRIDGEIVADGRIDEGLAGPARAVARNAWEIDDVKLRAAMLRPGTATTLELPWTWRSGRHTVELEVEPGDDVEEVVTNNNRRADRTDALAFVFVVRAQDYNAFTERLGPTGSASFEDWIQHQLARLRQRFVASVYPSAPDGIEEDVRADMIQILADSELPGAAAAAIRGGGWDGHWDHKARPSWPAPEIDDDDRFVRDVAKELGLVDLSALDLPGARNHVCDDDGLPITLGYRPAPGATLGDSADGAFPEHTALALNRMRGARRGYVGVHLFDVPRVNTIRVLDRAGQPLDGALVTGWRADRGRIPQRILFAGQTDDAGRFALPAVETPRHPTTAGPELGPNPFGRIDPDGGNALFLLRLDARGQADWKWLDISRFNLAFWNGNEREAVYDVDTRIPVPGAPTPPASVRATVDYAPDGSHAWVRWEPTDPPPARYRVVRAWSDAFVPELVAEVPGVTTAIGEQLPAEPPARIARYRVLAVDADGRAGAASPAGSIAILSGPAGIAILPDGRILVCDPAQASPVVYTPDGRPLGAFCADTDGAFPADAAVTDAGETLLLDLPDAATSFRRAGFLVYDGNGEILSRYDTVHGDAPDALQDPRGICTDHTGRVFVTDSGNHRVCVFTDDGTAEAQFGGLGPNDDQLMRPLGIDACGGEVAVADSGNGRVMIYAEDEPGRFAPRRSIDGFREPAGIAFDARGRLWICDPPAGTVTCLNASYEPVGVYDGVAAEGVAAEGVAAEGVAAEGGPFARPTAVAVDAEGRIVVVDAALRALRIAPETALTPRQAR